MPGATYPKPDGEKINRVAPQFGWVNLPERNPGRAPKLPPVREWTAETLRWWADLWRKPQASQWDKTGSTAVPMAVLYDQLQAEPDRAPAILAEMRQHEDRHGLNPKAMLQLRWRFDADATPAAKPAKSAPAKDRRGTVLSMVPRTDAAS